MGPITFLFVAVFAICFMVGILALFFYNQFTQKQVKIVEAQENISLFLSKRRSAVENLQPLLDRLDETVTMDVRHLLELSKKQASVSEIPGQTRSTAEEDQSAQRIMKYLTEHGASSQIAGVLDQMERAEIELNGSRRYYNALVREYNILVSSFPSAVVALLFRFKEKEYLSLPTE